MNSIIKTIINDEDIIRQVSEDVDLNNDNYMGLIEQIRNYCENNRVYSLTPIQIGIPKRLIYLRNTTTDMDKNRDPNYNEDQILINPVVISEEGHTRYLERCASCLDFVGTVDRPYLVEVEYYTTTGEKVRKIFEGFKATVFSHEYDHLNGITHIDLARDVCIMTYEETREYRKIHPYEIISKKGEYFLDKKVKKLRGSIENK